MQKNYFFLISFAFIAFVELSHHLHLHPDDTIIIIKTDAIIIVHLTAVAESKVGQIVRTRTINANKVAPELAHDIYFLPPCDAGYRVFWFIRFSCWLLFTTQFYKKFKDRFKK